MGIFRIINAELIKLLKRPILYVMATILLVVMLATVFIFSPAPYNDTSVTLSGSFIPAKNRYESTTYAEHNRQTENSISPIPYYSDINTHIDNLTAKLSNIHTLVNNYNSFSDKNVWGENYVTAVKEYKSTSEEYLSILSYSATSILRTYGYLNNINTKLNSYVNELDTTYYYGAVYNGDRIYQNYTDADINALFVSIYNKHNDIIKYAYDVMLDNILNQYQTYLQHSTDGTNIATIENDRKALKNSIENALDTISKLTQSDTPLVYVATSDYNNILDTLTSANNTLILSLADSDKLNRHKNILSALENLNTYNTLRNAKSKVYSIQLSKQDVANLISIKEKIIQNAEKASSDAQNSTDINKLSTAVTNHYHCTLHARELMQDHITEAIAKTYGYNNIHKLYGEKYENYNEYNVRSRIQSNTYYVMHNTNRTMYLDNLQLNNSSSMGANMYDYAYYVLKIMTICISMFVIVLACMSVAEESENGTIKLLLMRPYKRYKIILAKLLTIMLTAILLLVFGFIIAIVAGLAKYGIPSINTILVVFNASSAYTVPAFVQLLYALLCMLGEITFYLILSFMISTLIRSFGGSMSTGFAVMIVAIAVNIVLANAWGYMLLPFYHLDLFRFTGNSTLIGTDMLSKSFVTPTLAGSSYFVSLLIYAIWCIGMLCTTFIVFKKKEF